MTTKRVLIVDDEESIRHVVATVLDDAGWETRQAESAERALALLDDELPDVAVVDIILPGMNGIELLRRIKSRSPDTEVVIMTSHASIETAVGAIREGAYDYLEKPFDSLEQIPMTLDRAVEKHRLARNNRELLDEQSQRNRELSTTVTRLSSLIEAGRAMGDFDSLDELLDFFVGLVSRELDVDRASLMLLDSSGTTLAIAASRGMDEIDPSRIRVRLGEGIAGSVASSGEPLLVDDASETPMASGNRSLSDSFISAPIVLSMPIKARRDVLGVINVTNRRSGIPFDEGDVEYLAGLAGQLAVAIERGNHLDSLTSAQKQLIVVERLKALGQMAAGVAHDFNNTLALILNRAETAQGRLVETPIDVERIRRDLESICRSSLRGASTIRRIQDYTRIRKDSPDAEVDLNEVVSEAVEMTRPRWQDEAASHGRRIEMEVHRGDIPRVTANFHELVQVLDNLIFNAADAMPDGGTITIATRCEGEHVLIDFSDTGLGMSEAVRQRVFEPFFTTKKDGQGLGTSIAFGIVSRHLGDIQVVSEPGSGTCFTVRLPTAVPSGQPSTVHAREALTCPGTLVGKVLLVDDEDDLREMFAELLIENGHEVVTASSGEAAIEAFRACAADIVVTDLSMSGISGLEVASAVKRQSPETPVVLISGWAMQQEEPAVRDAGVDFVIGKPCHNETLLRTVEDALRLRAVGRDLHPEVTPS